MNPIFDFEPEQPYFIGAGLLEEESEEQGPAAGPESDEAEREETFGPSTWRMARRKSGEEDEDFEEDEFEDEEDEFEDEEGLDEDFEDDEFEEDEMDEDVEEEGEEEEDL